MSDLSTSQSDNIYLRGALLPLFGKTALPLVLVMTINGLFSVVDAYFLGVYVGADALVAVTLMFPFYMITVALANLVGNGFSSIYARRIGASDTFGAESILASALTLALLVCALLMLGDLAFGATLSRLLANGSDILAELGHSYIRIIILFSPLNFILAINVSALRSRGKLSLMTMIMLLSALLNIAFDWLLVAQLGFGVVGSAYGTALAQGLALAVLFAIQLKTRFALPSLRPSTQGWSAILALGAPTSLGYLGMSLSAGLTLIMLQSFAGEAYADTSGAFGIMTRLMTFTFMPLLGLSLAFQTIAGNNFGAGNTTRTRQSLTHAMTLAFVYCAVVQLAFTISVNQIGALFVDDTGIQTELTRILPVNAAGMFLFGPLMMVSTYYQAIGDAPRAGLLGLSRTYLFGLPFIACLPFVIGEWGIWLAGPLAELCVLALTAYVARALFKR